jgi:hypothetical protein
MQLKHAISTPSWLQCAYFGQKKKTNPRTHLQMKKEEEEGKSP